MHLHGRLEILLCPLSDLIPCFTALQFAFINPPMLELDFTGAANVADFSAIDGTVRKTILSTLNSMLTLVRTSQGQIRLAQLQVTICTSLEFISTSR